MMRHKNSSDLAVVAMFFATMLVIHFLTSIIFNILPLPIKPTLVHIPVVIASIIYGPKIGAYLGFLMGIISVVTNTVVQIPSSYLFSPFVEGGNLNSLVIALIPRILIGVFPYFIYKLLKNRFGLFLAGAIGSATNTFFVLSGIFFLFASVYQGDIKLVIATIVTGNAIPELIITSILTAAITPALLKLSNNK